MDTYAPVCKGAIISQLRVWPFPFAIIVAFGERSQNPGHIFTGAFNCTKICLKSLTYHNTDICHYLHEKVRFLDPLKYPIGQDMRTSQFTTRISVFIGVSENNVRIKASQFLCLLLFVLFTLHTISISFARYFSWGCYKHSYLSQRTQERF